MARIVHLAMNVEDIDKASEFFNKVFGFTRIEVPGLRSTVRYLSDGNIHLAINPSRRSKETADKEASRPRIDHFGIEVDDFEKYTAEVGKQGCKVVSEPGKALKFRAPGGIILEVIPAGTKPGIGDAG
jgi:catechol 2,3-dioxygenase-like lactoylglutathione lyase family enzyme